jgi:hypothetical protein
MNNLPNEILLKIFGKVDWEYQLYHPLNLICKRWNELIQKHEINFDTDYNTVLHLKQSKFPCSFKNRISKNEGIINVYIRHSDTCTSDELENLLLKIPAYKLIISNADFPYNSRLLKFHNKHIKCLTVNKYIGNYMYQLNKIIFLSINYRYFVPFKFTYVSCLKIIQFYRVHIMPNIFDFIKKSNKLIKIEFIGSAFFQFKEDKLLDIFDCRQFNNNSKILFSKCHFGKKEFKINERNSFWSPYYYIDELLFNLDDNKWFFKTSKDYELSFWYIK